MIYRPEGFCWYFQTTKTQKAHPSGWALHLFDAWQFPTLTWGDPTLPSAWGQVGPPRYRRQANSVVRNESFTPMLRWLHS